MAKVSYLVVNGMVLQQDRDGVVREYRPDTNGNTVALTDATTATDTWEYWPYGEVRSRTGSNPTPFQFVGTLGYYTDSISRLYVRARHYRPKSGRWQTVDPLWPYESAYGYVRGRPHQEVDVTGRDPVLGAVLSLSRTPAITPVVAAAGLVCTIAVVFYVGVIVVEKICTDDCYFPFPTTSPPPTVTVWPVPDTGPRPAPWESSGNRGRPVPPHVDECRRIQQECIDSGADQWQGIFCWDCFKMCFNNGFWDFSQRKCRFPGSGR